ncbi:30S ribosomal protein S2 [Cellulomonas sp. S1-8]|uniref:30S ribosomal protein S2 n=1 Tax=Cellulomonas sp. S1-8 TaxID=2904790 RepID=UPI002243C7E7|nr:30S ribosomal protein S2 [Cellulomonas sp. S1-8]UZN04842.1 30S ribosomal protein S2 [Cellulomonas sp. S1-8]
MAVVTMRQLLESGVHFGHQTRRWNPKMKRFIFTERNGIYIVDLQQSLSYIDRAYDFVSQTIAHGGSILFVGTKKQAQEPVAEQAARVGMPYVNQRWLGGMLTNFSTVHKRLQRLKELEQIDFDDVAGSSLTKKELLVLRREKDKLAKTLGGIRDMAKVPSAVWIVDTNKEHLAVNEARKLGIPVVAILDTNCDPDVVDYPIPGNDDAIRAVQLLTRVIADAVADGTLKRHSGGAAAAQGGDAAAEPLAEWERELLAGAEAGLADTAPAAGDTAAAIAGDAESAPGTARPEESAVAPGDDAAPAVEAAAAAEALEEAAVAEVTEAEPAAEAEVTEPAAEAAEPAAEVTEPTAEAAEPAAEPAATEGSDKA